MTRNLERDLVNKVASYITSRSGDQSEVLGQRVGLWRYPKLKKQLPDSCFLHPDIDILLSPKAMIQGRRELVGVEVKAIYMKKLGELNTRFYKGLDEAIALLRFGLDRVVFFQVFLVALLDEGDREAMPGMFIECQIPVRELIRNLRLPISYTPALDFLVGDKLMPDPIQVLDLKDPDQSPGDKQLILRYKGLNPFLTAQLEYPKVIRGFLLAKYC